MISLLGMILPFFLKIGMWWLDTRGATKEEKVKFLDDFSAMQSRADGAVTAYRQAVGVLASMDQWEKEQAEKAAKEAAEKKE
jgi:hypothetical protein